MHLTPKDQIVLLAGLETDVQRRDRIWALPELRPRLERLVQAGLVEAATQAKAGTSAPAKGGGKARSKSRVAAPTAYAGLSDPDGVRAASCIRHIALDDLMAEHLSEQP